MYTYNTILCIISPLHQITKKKIYIVNTNARVFLMQHMVGTVTFTLFSRLTALISLSKKKYFFESRENIIVEIFFC